MDHLIYLTEKQAEKLESALDVFYTRATESSLPPKFILILGGVRNSVKSKMNLEQHQLDVALYVVQTLLDSQDEGCYDPVLEQVHFKLAGWWHVDPPWFERIKDEEIN